MFFFLILIFNSVSFTVSWDPSNFTFNPGDDYELVWQDEFENIGPVKAIINGQPAYSPDPRTWFHRIGAFTDGGLENYTDSIFNSYVQNGQLTIVAMKEGYQSAMLRSQNLREFTFGVFASKIRMPYGQGMWPAWWLKGNGDKFNLTWPTSGEIDIIEMVGGSTRPNKTDKNAYGTIHWNNQSNQDFPVYNQQLQVVWQTPDGSKLHDNSLVYWTEWTPTSIVIGINEFIYSHINTTDLPNSINPVWAFSGKWPFYMVLDLAIGGVWALPPDNTTVWPQQMVVDWVRVFQKKNDPQF